MDTKKFKEEAKQKVDEAFDKVKQLEKKRDEASESAKEKYQEQVEKARSKAKELQAKYQDLEKAAEGKLEEAKNAFSRASDSFKEGWKEIKSAF